MQETKIIFNENKLNYSMTVSIKTIKEKYSPVIMKLHNVNGIGIAKNEDGKEIIKVYVSKGTKDVLENVPKKLEGYNVEIEEVGEILDQ